MRAILLSIFFGWLGVTSASAADIKPINEWHICHSDAECVLGKGVCGPFAINSAYQASAEEYHKQQDKPRECPHTALPTPTTAACKYEGCVAIYN